MQKSFQTKDEDGLLKLCFFIGVADVEDSPRLDQRGRGAIIDGTRRSIFGIDIDVEIVIIKSSSRKKSSTFVVVVVVVVVVVDDVVAFSSQNSISNNVVLFGCKVVVGADDHEVGVRAVDA